MVLNRMYIKKLKQDLKLSVHTGLKECINVKIVS
jgi:hypothetical protein